MKRLLFSASLAFGLLLTPAFPLTAAERPKPRPSQLQRIREGLELYGIVHWGPNTYTDREWGFGDEDPKIVNPTKFDADQIVGACKAGGLQGLIVVAKHHDGFCLWPTKTTEHNITKSPFRDGKGDYVREMERACRRAGIRFGVYISPWDRNNAAYATPAYVETFHAQIRELLGGDYGEVFEMWFDGANGGDGYYGGKNEPRKIGNDYYRFDALFAEVRRMQPSANLFNEDDRADCRWPGNEMGVLHPDSRATMRSFDYDKEKYLTYCNTGDIDGVVFHPCESDFPLRPGWFYHPAEDGKARSGIYLLQRYLETCGNGATMNIGVAPTPEGVLCAEDVKSLADFGKLKDRFFANRVTAGPCNVVVMREDVSEGEKVDAWTLSRGDEKLASGKSIGIKRIRILDKPVPAGEIRLAADGEHKPALLPMEFYSVDPDFVKAIRESTTSSGETGTARWMTVGGEVK